MPLNDANAAFLAELEASGAKPVEESTPEEVRALEEAMCELFPAGPEMASVRDAHVPAADGYRVPVRILVPHGDVRGVIVYYHGGGWVIGSITGFDVLGRKLAERTSCAVVLVGYRLAPEHRYPTAVDDADAAVQWVAEHVAEIAGSDVPLAVAGDSAGGNLATVVTRRARDRGGPPIALQVLVYPATDADLGKPTYSDPQNQLLLTMESMVWFWDHYAPDANQRLESDASPLRADDLSGLPPAVVILAEYDVLRQEGEAYAARLAEAGVPVDLHVHDGQMHGFFSFLMLPGHDAAIDQVAAAVDQRTSR